MGWEGNGAMRIQDFDECTCGDYRRDHEGGTGRCGMWDNLVHGFEPCDKFTLYHTALRVPPPWAETEARS